MYRFVEIEKNNVKPNSVENATVTIVNGYKILDLSDLKDFLHLHLLSLN